MKVKILATGSSGNCVLLDGRILVDAGISIKALEEHGIVPEQLSALFITHKHTDHMKLPLVRHLLKAGVKVYLPKAAIAEIMDEGKLDVTPMISLGQVTPMTSQTTYEVDGCLVTPYTQKHHDIVNFAFVMEKDGHRLLYCTDLDTVAPTDVGVGLMHLGMFDTILLEGNYDESYLRSYIEYVISLVPEAEDPRKSSDEDLEHWVKANYRSLPDEVARNAFRAIQNHRHLSRQQARAYVLEHLKPTGRYYEIHRSSQFYEAPEGWYER